MKISNETKVGALTAISITLLVLGFNFFKGKSLLNTGNFLYAKFTHTKELKVSNGVYVNGYQIGSVYEIENEDKNLQNIIVGFKLNNDFNIPNNSITTISSSPLGNISVDIKLGDSKTYLQNGDTIKSENVLDLMASFTKQLAPIGDNLKNTLHSLDVTLKNFNSILDPNSKTNLQKSITNISQITESLSKSSASINAMLAQQSGSIAKSMDNVNSITKNLVNQNEKINATLENVKNTTENLSQTDFKGTILNLKNMVDNLNGVIAKLNNTNGSLGLLMNDKALYNNLTNTVRSVNILMDDLKTNPKRYINISVFGKKDKSIPLNAPLENSKP